MNEEKILKLLKSSSWEDKNLGARILLTYNEEDILEFARKYHDNRGMKLNQTDFVIPLGTGLY